MIRHNHKELDAKRVEKILGKSDPFKGRHNKDQLIAAVLQRQGESNRYVYERGSKDGKPTLKVIDRYGSPLFINEFEFAFMGIDELDGYGAVLIEKIINMLGNERMPTPTNQMAHALR